MGRVWSARRAIRYQNRPAPTNHHGGQHPQLSPSASIVRLRLRLVTRGQHHGPPIRPLDPVDLPPALQLVFQRRNPKSSPHLRTRSQRLDPRADRRRTPRLHPRSARQLVARSRHRACQRRNRRVEIQRAHRRAPSTPSVDAPYHEIRPASHRRTRSPRLAGLHQDAPNQLDRKIHRRRSHLRPRWSRRHRLHHPTRHPIRCHLHGARPRAPAGQRHHHNRQARGRRYLHQRLRQQVRSRTWRPQQRQIRHLHRRLRHQSGERGKDPRLDCRLRHDVLRHRSHHGRPRSRHPRLRVCHQVWPTRSPSRPRRERGRPARTTRECGRLARTTRECRRLARILQPRTISHHHPPQTPPLATKRISRLRHLATRRQLTSRKTQPDRIRTKTLVIQQRQTLVKGAN